MTSRTLRSPILLADFIGNFSASLQPEHGNFIEVLNFEAIWGRAGAAKIDTSEVNSITSLAL